MKTDYTFSILMRVGLDISRLKERGGEVFVSKYTEFFLVIYIILEMSGRRSAG